MKAVVINGLLTSNYADNQGTSSVRDQSQSLIYISYTKGTEAGVLVLIEFTIDRLNNTEFFPYSYIDISDNNSLKNCEILISQSGKYRIPIPCGLQEDQIRLSAKAASGTPSGSITIYHGKSYYSTPPGAMA